MSQQLENLIKEFQKHCSKFEDQKFELVKNPELSESSQGYFGLMVRRGNEVFRVIDFGHIEDFIIKAYNQGRLDGATYHAKRVEQELENSDNYRKDGTIMRDTFLSKFAEVLKEIKGEVK